MWLKPLTILCSIFLVHANPAFLDEEEKATKYLVEVDRIYGQAMEKLVFAQWHFNTNITDENEQKLLQVTAEFNKIQKDLWVKTTKFNHSNFKNESVKRQYEKFSVIGISALDDAKANKFANVSAAMETIYSTTTVCVDKKCGLELEPGLTKIMARSRNATILNQTWTEWHKKVGRPIRPLYLEYVQLGNEAAKLNKLKTFDDIWMFPWETPDAKEQMEKLWKEVEGLYKKIHAYVRMKLRKVYPMPEDGTIPAHLLGNMWAQTWNNIMDKAVPFPNKPLIDVTNEMVKQKYTAIQMHRLSDKFYADLGLIAMPQVFWNDSMFVKPSDRKVVCHASAWDFYNKKDFRVKMCTDVTMNQLVTVHHEMGHIEYFLQYKDQPTVFQEGANPGFHEAIGDLMALSVSTPAHLNKIGLLKNFTDDPETTINFQMDMALRKLVFLPFSYLMDEWRWDVFSGRANVTTFNRRWWELRLKKQGVSPPVKRSERDCDACAKYHIPAGVEYIRYFVSHILQFSFHKALCQMAQPNVPLHKCDVDGDRKAGKKFAEMLKLGSSKPWPEQLEMITGSKQMNAKALIEYFQPLIKYIDGQLKNERLGWTADVNRYFESS